MPITLNQLASFLAVARAGSVSAAADELHVTQPSISASLASLQREVGVELTRRSGRGIALTAAGEAFRPYAADVLGLLDQGTRAATEAADRAQRTLRLVAVATAAEYLVPSMLREFTRLHPETEIMLEVANRNAVFERVGSHEADVGIGGRPPPDGRVVGTAFTANALVVIAAPDDPLVRARSVAIEALGERTWLQREPGSGTRELVTDFLHVHGLRPPTLTLGSNGAIKQAVQLGLGVTLQSRIAVEQELRDERLGEITVRGGLPKREWFALRAPASKVRPSVAAFLDFVSSYKRKPMG
jgi:LysR family transcriptional regulator, low CO2-responsive transcriptional regulator